MRFAPSWFKAERRPPTTVLPDPHDGELGRAIRVLDAADVVVYEVPCTEDLRLMGKGSTLVLTLGFPFINVSAGGAAALEDEVQKEADNWRPTGVLVVMERLPG